MNIEQDKFVTFETHTGLPVRVRHLRTSDAPFLLQIFEHMSSESRYHRFNQPVDNVSDERKWEEAERIARTNPQRSGGFIAFADLPGESNVAVAAARYVCIGEEVAEAAMSVVDALQRQGLGTHLMTMLVDLARRDGIKYLTADIRNDNRGIWKILDRLPYAIRRDREGAFSQIVVDLTSRLPQTDQNEMETAVS